MKKIEKFIKFCIVGLSNTLISLLVYYILNFFGVNYLVAMGSGYILSSISGYILNKIWVFKQKDKDRSIYRYYVLYISAFILNLLLMKFQVDVLGISALYAPIFTVVVTTLYNYFISNLWVFNKEFKFDFNKIKEDIKSNKVFYVLLVIFIILIIFLLKNNLYNHAVADDFSNYNALVAHTKGDFIASLSEFIVAVFNRSVEIYKTWQGTYFSNILFSINPIIISENLYKFTMVLIQIFWLVSTFIFFKTVSKKDNKKDYYILFFLLIIFSVLFSYSLGEGFYWFTGAVMYLIPYSISLLLFAAIAKYLKSNKKLLLPVIIILSIILAGTSYITGLFVGFVYCCICLYMLIKKDKRKYVFIGLLILFAICFAFNVLCPGNFNRVNSEVDTSFLEICGFALINAVDMIRNLIFKTAYIPFMVISFPAIRRIVQKSKIKFEHPFILIVLCFICFVCLFMPMAFSYKNAYQETRVMNIQLFYLVIMLTVCFINLYGSLYKKKVYENDSLNFNCILVGAVTSIIIVGVFPNIQGNILMDDILHGTSKKYDVCIKNMNDILENSDEEKVTITQCEVYPNSLHYYIMESDGWINDAMSVYYKKEIEVEKYGN